MEYIHKPLSDFEAHPHKPGERWAVSSELGIKDYNLNVAVLEQGDPLSQTHFHAHENQDEFYYVIDGCCQFEIGEESIKAESDEVIFTPRTIPHLVHNPYKKPCKLIAIGSPPEGRYPVTMYDNYQNISEERYDDSDGDE